MWDRKHRPARFSDVVGNAAAVAALEKLTNKKDPPHSYLLQGPSGTGKTTLARIAARAFGANAMGIEEIDIADFGGVDMVRSLRERASFLPMGGGKAKIYILDEAHMLSTAAQNGLLKILEEPPAHVSFFLCTTDPQKLIKTVRTRCIDIMTESPTKKEISGLLQRIAKMEGASFAKGVRSKIAEMCGGSPRKAVTTLERVSVIPKAEQLAAIGTGDEDEKAAIELCRLLVSSGGKRHWAAVAAWLRAYPKKGPADAEGLRRAVLGYSSACLLRGQKDLKYYDVLASFRDNVYDSGFAGLVGCAYEAVFSGE